MMTKLFRRLALFLILSVSVARGASEFQYSVPVATQEGRRAYLWIPPNCLRVRGLIFCINNMLEERFTMDPTIRAVAAETGLGIVWIQPGRDPESPLTIDLSKGSAVAAVDRVLADLAAESGYAELAQAPLIIEEHSAASPFGFGIQSQMPDRIIAAIPLKGFDAGLPAPGIPNLKVGSEWAEHGEGWKQPWTQAALAGTIKMRQANAENLIGEFVDLGSGHFDYTPQSSGPIALFIRKAMQTRVPAKAGPDGSVTLRAIDPKSGWLIDPAKLGTPGGQPVPYARFPGNPQEALWYFDLEMGNAANHSMLDQVGKKPQVLDLIVDGQPAALGAVGLVSFTPAWEADGFTFKVKAAYLDHSPAPTLYGGGALGHGSAPVQFRVGSGALKQVGPDAFRVWPHRGVLLNQGNPWEPWIIGFSNGDEMYRRTDRPFHPNLAVTNRDGTPQTLDFPKIADQSVKSRRPIPLTAKASSGLAVQYFMISGPAEIDGNQLKFDPVIPSRTRLPMRVLVAAFQWGRATDPKVPSAGPIVQEFFLRP